MSGADKAKLDLIAPGAEVNVQSDWAQTDNTQDDFIKNKPATFPPPAATASVLGGVKAGTGVAIAADGTLSVSLTGGLVYKGTTDPTKAPPASPTLGDVWIASKGGAYEAGWSLTGTATEGELLIWQGSKWDAVGEASVTVKPDWNAAANAADEILNKPGAVSTTADGLMSAADKVKLDGIDAGAEVNVKPDWSAAPGDAAEILNKPTIPTLVKPDWNAAAGSADEILNKPTIPTLVKPDWNAAAGDAAEVLNKPTIPTIVDGDTTQKGIVQLATAAQAAQKTNTTLAVTPAGLQGELANYLLKDLSALPALP